MRECLMVYVVDCCLEGNEGSICRKRQSYLWFVDETTDRQTVESKYQEQQYALWRVFRLRGRE